MNYSFFSIWKLLNPLFDSISGTISRRRFSDGRVETIVATKKGTIYKRTTYPKRTFPGRG